MKSLFIKHTRKIKENLSQLQKEIRVGIEIKDNFATITGEESNVYDAERILTAMDLGFPIEVAILLIEDEYMLEEMRIKDFTRRKNLVEVRARLIGTEGRTKKTMQELSNCCIRIKDNSIFIIGTAEDIVDARTALENLIHGSKHGNVYGFLEKARKREKGKRTRI